MTSVGWVAYPMVPLSSPKYENFTEKIAGESEIYSTDGFTR